MPDVFIKMTCQNCGRVTEEFELDPPHVIRCPCGRYCLCVEHFGEVLFFCCRETSSLREET